MGFRHLFQGKIPTSTSPLTGSSTRVLILGKKDPVLNYEENVEQIDGTIVKLISFNDGHMSHIENQVELEKVIVGFLKG